MSSIHKDTGSLGDLMPIEIYKPDWAEAAQRMCDWWAGKKLDRVVAHIVAPRQGVAPCPVRGTVEEQLFDPNTVFYNLDAWLEATFFGGEAFPVHLVYLGPVPLSAYLGCELHATENTTWQAPIYDAWDVVDQLNFDPTNKWWRLACELMQASVERAKGRYWVASCVDPVALSDAIANMWGSERTLMAMAEEPQTIQLVRDKMLGWFDTMYEHLYQTVAPRQGGYMDWLTMWAPGRISTFQSDLSCMISPQMFDDLILEEIRHQAKYVDYSFYHLDGPGAIKHLDSLLSIPELDGIQWVPGAGVSQDPMDWIPVFRKVQEAGKKLYIYTPPNQVRPLLNAISREGVLLSVGCPDEITAREVLAELKKIGY